MNLDFSTLSLSILYLNLTMLLLFIFLYYFFFWLLNVSNVDMSIVSATYMIRSKRELT